MDISPVHQVWPKPSCKARWKGEEDKADKKRGEKITSGNRQAWSSSSSRGQRRAEKNGGNWLWNRFVVPQRPSRLRDRWWRWWWHNRAELKFWRHNWMVFETADLLQVATELQSSVKTRDAFSCRLQNSNSSLSTCRAVAWNYLRCRCKVHLNRSENSYLGFDSRSRQGEGPFFSFSESSPLCRLAVSVPVSLSCAQHALRSLRTLKIPCAIFDEWRPNGQWHGNTQITHNSSRMIEMTIVVTHINQKRERETERERQRQRQRQRQRDREKKKNRFAAANGLRVCSYRCTALCSCNCRICCRSRTADDELSDWGPFGTAEVSVHSGYSQGLDVRLSACYLPGMALLRSPLRRLNIRRG